MITMSPFDSNIAAKLNRSGMEFLLLDLQTALTFCEIARTATDDPGKRLRNLTNARKAY